MSDEYYPGPWDEWKRKEPKDVGMDAGLLGEAVAFSNEHETSFPRDQALRLATVMGGKKCDDGEILGQTRPRGGPNGLVLRHGYIVAEWGETRRVDMTYSATKSYLSTCAGLALDRGLIRDVHDPVKEYTSPTASSTPRTTPRSPGTTSSSRQTSGTAPSGGSTTPPGTPTTSSGSRRSPEPTSSTTT